MSTSALQSRGRATGDKNDVLKAGILALIYVIAFIQRLYSVIRFESVIHEFDPYFNFRTTKYLAEEGFYAFHNWFDSGSWYPLGRIIGGTIYPGLMVTAASMYWALNFLRFTINIRNVCVFTAPFFASNTAMIVYSFTTEILKDNDVKKETLAQSQARSGAGLFAAAFVAIVPGYISRSVAGSYDNEGVAIFALIATFYLFIKSVNTGSLFWSACAALAYFYMASAWGGYIFIINIIPVYVLAMIAVGRYSSRLYVAYSTLYILGTLLAMQIQFIGFQAVQSSEHMGAMIVFAVLQAKFVIDLVTKHIGKENFRIFYRTAFVVLFTAFVGVTVIVTLSGYRTPWTGRFWTLLDPTYAKEHIPIIASVSEHQPTTWSSFFFDLQILNFGIPAGVFFCIQKPSDGKIFAILYGLFSVYFTGVMVRLMLVVAPIACVLSGITFSQTFYAFIGDASISASQEDEAQAASGNDRKNKRARSDGKGFFNKLDGHKGLINTAVIAALTLTLASYVRHCTWVTSEAYSSPSIVLAAKQADGSRIIFDDFREAYWWLRQNTKQDARVMSWWDYGYQITAMANRTILVDNNTWNNTHIATVGRAMASTEEVAYETMLQLDVDYVLVVFGGLTGYSSDDINKFLWMVRIGGGVYGDVKEPDYFTPKGEFKVDKDGSPTMLNSFMYKMCYYRFGQVLTDYNHPAGYDRVRNCEIGNKDFTLDYVEEAYTTEHWIVRIYKVKKPGNRG